jgi:16S rRNA (cytosine967-C5)-methyltransferase
VLVDAPCSGSGTLRRHPEILLCLKKMALSEYPVLQRALLEKGFQCLKPGGVLVYSTCSILSVENQDVVQAFLNAHPQASLECEQTSHITAVSDGFYWARIRKAI